MLEKIWRLTIEKENAQVVQIHGPESVMKAAFEAWIDHENTSTDEWVEKESIGENYRCPEAGKVRQIKGHLDDATRSVAVIGYRFADVIGMCLLEM